MDHGLARLAALLLRPLHGPLKEITLRNSLVRRSPLVFPGFAHIGAPRPKRRAVHFEPTGVIGASRWEVVMRRSAFAALGGTVVVLLGLLAGPAFASTTSAPPKSSVGLAAESAPNHAEPACVTLLSGQRDRASGANKVKATVCAATIDAAREQIPEIAARVRAVKSTHSRVTDANINSGATTVASRVLLARAYKNRGYTGYIHEIWGDSGPCDSGGYRYVLNGYASVANIAGSNCNFLEFRTYPGDVHVYTYSLPTADCWSNCNPGRYWILRSTL